MHRFILGYNGKNMVDHINNNKLDNRKVNLRIVTPQQNNMNRTSSIKTSSKYIGVSYNKLSKKWYSQIYYNSKHYHLGSFTNEIDAAKARDIGTIKYFGDFGNLNIPK